MSEEPKRSATTTTTVTRIAAPSATAPPQGTFHNGDGCCECKCCDAPMGTGSCCFTFWCPCFAMCVASQDSKVDDLGILYGILGFVPFGNLVSLTILSMNVEEKRNLQQHGCCWHCCCSYWDLCTCHSCRVIAECKLYEQQTKAAAPVAQSMQRN